MIDDLVNVILEEIINVSFVDEQWEQVVLPVRFGGLGVRRVQGVAFLSFLAQGSHGGADLVAGILPFYGDGIMLPFVEEALEGWKLQCPEQTAPE